ncbi:dynein light chain Tctex-type 5-like isoform X1 [Neodiprion pinetum]|uniref:Dynein light chain Tctex-type 5-like isoform X1 n=1 Tax=Neodiprion lecontei TaxID=441921 RepID=A0A6J0BKG5_NEOLC|nr:dynein light chain Tctex-type 5-like isoform X1 [Neodiprion lecontei]XP_046433984.1 dynein light chain Tctex-type 5-like isoform X1 [Neodiprion fabricii]XP_046490547.1 dynein light chain Tctex-type 5-like isoform X1 [Neodiprion pinetum]
MAMTLVKSIKKRNDGRPAAAINRQGSIQAAINSSAIPKAPKYENSYRLESNKPFNVDPVDKIISQVMTNNLEDIVYDPKECPKLCAEISADIRDRIRKQNFDRYKIVVIVTINEKASQGIQASMRFLWDVQRDNYSSFTFETRTFFAYCCVFGVYCE